MMIDPVVWPLKHYWKSWCAELGKLWLRRESDPEGLVVIEDAWVEVYEVDSHR
jgi:hypothetical protein